MVKVSVIIPVYNTSKYLESCIKSVLCQSYENFELIMIDDGSKDNSYETMEAYAKLDARIHIYKQKNQGVSITRNKGLKYSQGEYITFIDSDDTIEYDFLERLVEPLSKKQFDLVLSGIVDVKDSNSVIKRVLLAEKEWDLNDGHVCLPFLSQELMTSPVAKLYKKSIIDNYNLSFNLSLSFAEDREFNFRYIGCIKNAYTINFAGYFYRRDVQGSLTKKEHPEAFKYDYLHWTMERDFLEKRNACDISAKAYCVNKLFNLINDEIVLNVKTYPFVKAYQKTLQEIKEVKDYKYLSENVCLIKGKEFVVKRISSKNILAVCISYFLMKCVYGKTC